jgi:hypothetical protein
MTKKEIARRAERKAFIETLARETVFTCAKKAYDFLKDDGLKEDFIHDMIEDILLKTIEHNLTDYLKRIIDLEETIII